MRKSGAAVPVSFLLLAACAGGSQSPPDLIPAPLVASLVGSPGDGRAPREITVGTIPPGYPGTLVPTGPVEIVGGMSWGREATAVFADSTRRLAAVLEEQFAHAGFTRPKPRPASGFGSAWGAPAFFCNDEATVSATQLTGAQRHHARVTYRRVGDRFKCGTVEPDPIEESLELPPLTPPPGVSVSSSGGGGSPGGVESRAEVAGSGLVPGAIIAHYAAQLTAAGWTAFPPAASPRVAAQFFEARNAGGAVWDGVLVASGSDSALALTLTMKPRRTR